MSAITPSAPLAAKLLFTAAMLLVAVSCTGRPAVPSSYGDPGSSVEKNFIKGCESESPASTAKASKELCQCAYAELKKTVPFAEFKKINSELSDTPDTLPDEFIAIIDGCKQPA